jgi:pimeloyl-ACP methyl ester carboxylesterase
MLLHQFLLDRPGADKVQLDLLYDYRTNVAAYPVWQAWFRAHQPKTLIVWGKGDPLFVPAGAKAYLRDLPKARLVFLEAGHFATETASERIAQEILKTFAHPTADSTRLVMLAPRRQDSARAGPR